MASGQIQSVLARRKCQSGNTLTKKRQRGDISLYYQRLGGDITSQDEASISFLCLMPRNTVECVSLFA